MAKYVHVQNLKDIWKEITLKHIRLKKKKPLCASKTNNVRLLDKST